MGKADTKLDKSGHVRTDKGKSAGPGKPIYPLWRSALPKTKNAFDTMQPTRGARGLVGFSEKQLERARIKRGEWGKFTIKHLTREEEDQCLRRYQAGRNEGAPRPLPGWLVDHLPEEIVRWARTHNGHRPPRWMRNVVLTPQWLAEAEEHGRIVPDDDLLK